MIVAVGSDKGSPGATTLATALALAWPTQRVLCELDPCGADLPFRLLGADAQHLRPSPSLTSLAVDARPGTAIPQLENYAQPSMLDVPVIPGCVTTRAMEKLARLLPSVGTAAAAWSGTAIVDLGRLQPWNPALVVARSATVVLLVTRASTEGLAHLRTRVEDLSEYLGDPDRERTPLGVVVVAEPGGAKASATRVRTLLTSIGSPAPVVGTVAHDPTGAAAMWSGPPTKKLTKSKFVLSAHEVLHSMWQLWPELADGALEPHPSTYSLMKVGAR